MRTKKVNEQYEKLTAILRDAGYHITWRQLITGTASSIECWLGERGALLVQEWPRAGLDVYHTEGIPVEWDALASWLRKA